MIESIFGTPILVSNINLPEEKLEEMRVSMRERIHLIGGAFNQYTGDNNGVDFNESQILSTPEFQCLIEPILNHARLYIDQVTSHSHEYQQYIMKSWPVVIGRGGSINQHTHEYAHLSAVFYLDDPEPNSGGEIKFVRPADQCLRKIGINEFTLDKKVSQIFTKIQSRKNGLVVFPASIPHFVSKYTGQKHRFSVSCDLMNIKTSGKTEATLISLDKWITM